MNLRKSHPKAAIIVDSRGDDRLAKKIAGTTTKASTSSTTSTISTCASTVATKSSCASSTKASSNACTAPGAAATTKTSTKATSATRRPSVAEIKAASKQDEFDDELESMLSLTQTLSFWNGEGDDDGDTYANNSYDNTSYSGSTYDSSSTYNDGRRRRGDRRFNNRGASCGEGLEDTLETFVITGRAISSALKIGSKSMNSLFMGKRKQQLETKENMMKREEERKMKRDAQLREEIMTSRYEISNVANLWREK